MPYKATLHNPRNATESPLPPVPSVTEICGVTDSYHGLMWWAEECGIKGGMALGPDFEGDSRARRAKLDELGLSSRSIRDLSAEEGTRVHWCLEQKLLGKPVEMPEDGRIRQLVVQAFNWFSDHAPVVAQVDGAPAVERTVFCREHYYTGTLDFLLKGPNGIELWDVKTSKEVRDSAHLQGSAYRYALAEEGIEVVDGFVLHLRENGYSVHKMKDRWEHFRAARKFHALLHPRPSAKVA